jgi:hypothetical protein
VPNGSVYAIASQIVRVLLRQSGQPSPSWQQRRPSSQLLLLYYSYSLTTICQCNTFIFEMDIDVIAFSIVGTDR